MSKFEEMIIQTFNLILWKPYFLTSLSGPICKPPPPPFLRTELQGWGVGWRLSLGCPEERVGSWGFFSNSSLGRRLEPSDTHSRVPSLNLRSRLSQSQRLRVPGPPTLPAGSTVPISFLRGYRLLQARTCAAEHLTSKPGSASLNVMLRNL